MKQSIVHIALVIRDYDEAIEFYTKKLSFTLVEDTYQPQQDKRWVVVSPPGSHGTTLLLAKASKPEQKTFIGNQTGGRVFLFLNTDNFWRDYNEMIAKGIKFVREPKKEPYGMVAVFEDLYGNLWDLLELGQETMEPDQETMEPGQENQTQTMEPGQENQTQTTQSAEHKWQNMVSAQVLHNGNPEATYKSRDEDFKWDSNSQDLATKAGATLEENYQLTEKLAQGGMGVIYKALQLSLKREIAIKKILSRNITQEKYNRFIAESQVTAYLDHPNIVSVHDLDHNRDGEVLLAMKLVGGMEWKKLIYSEKQQTVKEYSRNDHLEILINVCNAISYAHSKNITHNDLKPSNVMIGEFGEVLVMDWGLATDIGIDPQTARTLHKSKVNSPMGTPSYIAPELADGSGKNLGPWTDVYLLGAILYEILMKKPPHSGSSPRMAIIKAIRGKIPEFSSEVPEELKSICVKAMAKTPQDRYQKVAALQKAIQSFLKHEESIIIAEEAKKILTMAKTNAKEKNISSKKNKLLYSQHAQSISGFQQALKLWQDNTKATNGKIEALLSYAYLAIKMDDIVLAESLLAQIDQLHQKMELITVLREKKEKLLRSQTTSKILRYSLILSIVIIILGLSIGLAIVNNASQQTEQALKKEKQEREKAIRYSKNLEQEKEEARKFLKAVLKSLNYALTENAHLQRDREFIKPIKEVFDQLDRLKSKPIYQSFKLAVLSKSKKALETQKKIDLLTKIIQNNPKKYQAYLLRADCYRGQKKYKKALNDYNKAVQIRNRDPRCYFLRGNFYRQRKQYKRALNDYRKAIWLNPNFVQVYPKIGTFVRMCREALAK